MIKRRVSTAVVASDGLKAFPSPLAVYLLTQSPIFHLICVTQIYPGA